MGELATVAQKATSLAVRMGASPEMVELVRAQIAPGAPDDVLALFFARCQQLGADPLGKMLYVIPRTQNVPPERSGTGRWEKQTIWQMQSSIDLFRAVAESHEASAYAGQDGPYWCGEDGVWVDVWLKKEHPSAAKVGVLRHGFAAPLSAIATWNEYAQTDKDGKATGMWKNMPALMLAKCAEALALRKAFPAKLNGIYTSDEMAQQDNGAPVAAVAAVPAQALPAAAAATTAASPGGSRTAAVREQLRTRAAEVEKPPAAAAATAATETQGQAAAAEPQQELLPPDGEPAASDNDELVEYAEHTLPPSFTVEGKTTEELGAEAVDRGLTADQFSALCRANGGLKRKTFPAVMTALWQMPEVAA